MISFVPQFQYRYAVSAGFGFAVVSTQFAQPAAGMFGGSDGESEDDVTRECVAWQGQHHGTASVV